MSVYMASLPGSSFPFLKLRYANITCENLKESESLVWNHAYPWPFSIEFLPNHGWEGHGWAWFHTRLPLSFNFFVHNIQVGEVQRERESGNEATVYIIISLYCVHREKSRKHTVISDDHYQQE